MYPDAPLIQRNGEVDAWDSADFRAAVQAANKSQIIMAGIVTDVCEYLFVFATITSPFLHISTPCPSPPKKTPQQKPDLLLTPTHPSCAQARPSSPCP